MIMREKLTKGLEDKKAKRICTGLNNDEMMDNQKLNVAVIGSGSWGSTVVRIIGKNVLQHSCFHDTVKLYVHESIVNGRKLSHIINNDRENIKYLPGYKFPENIRAVPDVIEAALESDILVFVVPHQYIYETCKPLIGKVKPQAFGISLIKGVSVKTDGTLQLISDLIKDMLGINMSVLMGANLAKEIAAEQISETTVGYTNEENGILLKKLFHTEYFHITLCSDVPTVELCGALKNIVACGVGFADGLKCGENTKAAVIRLGLLEMIRFIKYFYPSSKLCTFLESCGVADLVTSCYGGRNRKVAEALVNSGKTIEELEEELLQGQKLQGPQTAETVMTVLKHQGLENLFPLFTKIHKICAGESEPYELINTVQKYPQTMAYAI
ncbi:glycerol-3-phosphate dehydrogenase [NAD(+)], cytoplasmic-like isoform X1 [Centruroides sculpturatus]|uniref:glycerol-3-phosphate dehydrogenase [NAD(+)], cytoplasmic-like isoform X1 n=2 Tax=Centruroides sculpturatus TaxID=218467 RepID=UPI000C6E426C|nr:glycerol-3-phosphate dehydrogenase [NAD(+)], cytoplasmic-like isoform X1 [Centruroides sculpturatus]XP_023222435.1 glycerol-3-phosphate dehydrogenase [NAD(+)], cytoplasmic-like isoform X1 [Centruroides sculpturatus]